MNYDEAIAHFSSLSPEELAEIEAKSRPWTEIRAELIPDARPWDELVDEAVQRLGNG